MMWFAIVLGLLAIPTVLSTGVWSGLRENETVKYVEMRGQAVLSDFRGGEGSYMASFNPKWSQIKSEAQAEAGVDLPRFGRWTANTLEKTFSILAGFFSKFGD